jgi:hypothetical protein
MQRTVQHRVQKTSHASRQQPHTDLAAAAAKSPGVPLVRDEESLPAKCLMRWSTEGHHGRSRTTLQAPRLGLTHVSHVAEET